MKERYGALPTKPNLVDEFTFQGRQIRRSTETTDKRMAEAILGKVRVQIIEGRFFEKVVEEQPRTFRELMGRFEAEHVPKKASVRSYTGCGKHLRAFFGDRLLAEGDAQGHCRL